MDGATARAWFEGQRPDVVVLAAAKPSERLFNETYPVDFLLKILNSQNNLIESAWRSGTLRLLFLGSRCIRPPLPPRQPRCSWRPWGRGWQRGTLCPPPLRPRHWQRGRQGARPLPGGGPTPGLQRGPGWLRLRSPVSSTARSRAWPQPHWQPPQHDSKFFENREQKRSLRPVAV